MIKGSTEHTGNRFFLYESQKSETITIYNLISQPQDVATHSLSSGELGAEGGFFLCSGGRALLVAVFALLEQVWETWDFEQLQKTQRNIYSAVISLSDSIEPFRKESALVFYSNDHSRSYIININLFFLAISKWKPTVCVSVANLWT